ncbi:MAG: hypothetical protein BMS9Abin11_0141 [Gammaproteobacteria bacterium]|nr:MAG: hypothetical protein BMS9Abin11_0141 [Gammaproteobacteria bacterium]
MFGDFLYKLRNFGLARSVSMWKTDLVFYWRSSEKDGLIFFTILASVVTTFAMLFYFMFNKEHDTRDLTCLALNIYHESRGEPTKGQFAVAVVTLNRVASRRYPNSICEVVYQQNWDRIRKRKVGAFSWTEFRKLAPPKGKNWYKAWEIAENVYYQRHANRLKGALFYHANYIYPSWAKQKKQVAKIGRHIFYR